MVVFPDVDLEAAVEGAVFGMNLSVCQGQSCGSNSRVLVHADIHDEFVEALAARLDAFRVTTAYTEESDMGPLVSEAHFNRVSGYLESGQQEGARLVTGGGRPDGVPDGGYFMRPAAFDDVEQGMAIAQEEIFGPIVSVLRWDRFDDMIEVANAVEYGLTAGGVDQRPHARPPDRRPPRRRLRLGQRQHGALCGDAVRRCEEQRHRARGVRGGAAELPRAEGRAHQARGAVELGRWLDAHGW